MMNCKNLHKEIIFYLENELDEKKQREVEAHLGSCPDCKAFADDLKTTLNLMGNVEPIEDDPFFYTRLKAKLENSAIHQPPLLWVKLQASLRPVFLGMLLLAGVFSGIKIGQHHFLPKASQQVSQLELVPYFNELDVESIESFLME